MLPPRPLFSPGKIQGRISSSWGDAGSYEFCWIAEIPDWALGTAGGRGSFALLRITDLILDGIFVLFYGGSVHSIFREEHEI